MQCTAPSCRIHIFGASGSGVSTLSRALAEQTGFKCIDVDDVFWELTDPPFQQKRPLVQRQELLAKHLEHVEGWVLAGSMCGWGNFVIPKIQLAIFLITPTPVRMARLQCRQRQQFGDRINLDGDMHQTHQAFIDWAVNYDNGSLDMRSRQSHEQWLQQLKCPLCRLDGSLPIDQLVKQLNIFSKLQP